ncbi:MAG: NAD(P)-binding protein [Phycisphaeraceae bacterium]|nr:NAD(P)-binding protein [Phycisphaeraceae bacterium]
MSKITRRDFINGTLMATGASMLPFGASSHAVLAALEPSYYPPALTGLRGDNVESYTDAHSKALARKSSWGTVTDLREEYDLIVVGGGISGLSAAFFYQQKHGKDKRVLILDTHADFGGQCARNEHTFGDATRVMFGGSQTIVSPHARSQTTLKLLKDLGIDLDRLKAGFDVDFYKRHNLRGVTYFNKRKFGEDKVVKHPFCCYQRFVEGLQRPELSHEEAVKQTPLSDRGKEQLLRVLKGGVHLLDVPQEKLEEYINTHSYFDYLKNTLGVDDPGVLEMARNSCIDNLGEGADVTTIADALSTGGLGFDPAMLKDVMGEKAYKTYIKEHGYIMVDEDPYVHHFPDGNASLTRLLVRKMIPNVGPGNSFEDIVLSKFDYSELDKSSNIVRLRLNSTAVKVTHDGDPENSKGVFVNYIHDKKAYQVKGKGVVMACYNVMIPHIVPNLPEEQATALSRTMRIPLFYTTVGLRNWRAMKVMEIGVAISPGNMHQAVLMDFPVSLGGHNCTKGPDDPCTILMVGCPYGDTVGAPPIEQFREARFKMLSLQFEDYEKEIREHLTGMLPKESFDFDRDVASITVNRWSHGYGYRGTALFDSDLSDMVTKGRKPFGRITIANIDSGMSSYIHVAIDQAWRAVKELG